MAVQAHVAPEDRWMKLSPNLADLARNLGDHADYSVRLLLALFVPDRVFTTAQFVSHYRRLPTRDDLGFSDYVHFFKSSPAAEACGPLVDKLLAKQRVSELIGDEHIVKTCWSGSQLTWDAWKQLPDTFMLKASHGCGWNYLVVEKSTEQFRRVSSLTARWMQKNFYHYFRERAYRNITPRLFAEQYVGLSGQPATDYKFYCIGGSIAFIMVIVDRQGDQKDVLYDRHWNKMDVRSLNPNDADFERPGRLERMVEIAEVLARGFDFARIDLYLYEDQVYFGEWTFTPAAGFFRFDPPSFDRALGDLLKATMSRWTVTQTGCASRSGTSA